MLQKNANIFCTEKNLWMDVREEKAPQMSPSWHGSCMKINLYSSICIIKDK